MGGGSGGRLAAAWPRERGVGGKGRLCAFPASPVCHGGGGKGERRRLLGLLGVGGGGLLGGGGLGLL